MKQYDEPKSEKKKEEETKKTADRRETHENGVQIIRFCVLWHQWNLGERVENSALWLH